MSPRRTVSDHVLEPSQILRVGTIVSVDLATGQCTAEVGDPEDESVETIEIQWGALRAGKTTVWSPPSEGEQILLFCPGGDIAQAIPFGALYSNAFPRPGDSLRELIQFEDGAVLAYDPEAHHLDILLPAGATTRIESDGGVSIKGDVDVEGKITATGDINGAGVSLKTHKHVGVAAGGGVTGMPQ